MSNYVSIKNVAEALDMAVDYFNKAKENKIFNSESCDYIVNGLMAAGNMLNTKNKFDHEYIYPENLFRAVFCQTVDHEITEDQRKGLDHVLKDLRFYEQEVIRLRFEEEKTLKEVGEVLNLSSERIRQIEAKALRRLRNPIRSRYLIQGYESASGELRDAIKAQRQQEIDEVNKEIDDILKKKREYIEIIINCKDPNTALEISDNITLIDDLELSVRAYKCLRRAGIYTIADLLKMNPDDIRKIRNLGRRSFEEICERLTENGFVVWGNGEPIMNEEV